MPDPHRRDHRQGKRKTIKNFKDRTTTKHRKKLPLKDEILLYSFSKFNYPKKKNSLPKSFDLQEFSNLNEMIERYLLFHPILMMMMMIFKAIKFFIIIIIVEKKKL